jgi:hypothetical protein
MTAHLSSHLSHDNVSPFQFTPDLTEEGLAGQAVTLSIHAKGQSLEVVYPQEYRRSLPLKGLQQRALANQEYVELMQREASTQQRLLTLGRWKVRPD